MGALKDRLQQQISLIEREIVRVDADAAASKRQLQANLATLKQADQALTPEIEALISALQRAGIKIFD